MQVLCQISKCKETHEELTEAGALTALVASVSAASFPARGVAAKALLELARHKNNATTLGKELGAVEALVGLMTTGAPTSPVHRSRLSE